MVGVPDSNVSEDFPVGEAQNMSLRASDIEGSVMAGDYANTLEVIVTTPGRARGYLDTNDTATLSGDRGIALVLRDDTHSAGREVALDAGAVRDALGHTPKQVYGTHENGEEWTANVQYEAGMLVFEVPHFSTNSVSFAGTVTASGTYTDRSSFNYDVSSLDSVSDFSINVTGHTATEWDNETASGLSPSGSTSLSIAGNADPSGPSANGEPVLSVTERENNPHNPVSDLGDGTIDRNQIFAGDTTGDAGYQTSVGVKPSTDKTISALSVGISKTAGADYGASVDIYIVEESPDTTYSEGTKVKDGWDPDWSTGDQIIDLDSSYQMSANTAYTVEFVTQNTDNDGSADVVYLGADDSSSQGWYTKGTSVFDNYGDLTVGPQTTVSGVSVSDDNSVSKSLGDFNDGETITVEFDVTTASESLNFSGSGAGNLNATLKLKERAETVDPSLEVNDHATSHSGALSDGETVSLTANESWIDSSNTVNVSVGDGSLGSDAPAPSVDLDYRHDAQDKQTVDYEGEKWSERYNVSKTYASDRSSATLTIPFDGDVTKIRSIETRTNGGTWSTVSSDNYGFDGTELTVQLGSVSAGDEVAVRTTGRKVNVIDGSITVLEPTVMGERLDTKFEIDSWQDGAYISLGNTPDGTRINYLYKESWDSDEFAEITSDGYHKMFAPGAGAGSSARVSTIPVRVNAESGEVRVSVDDPLRDEPKFSVAPGASAGDDVEFTFIDAQDDTDYALYSTTRDTAVDQGTANSPLTLSDDDSEETLQFQVDDDGGNVSSSGGGSFWDGGASGPVIPAMPVLNPGLVVVIVLGIIAGAIAYQQRRMRRPDVPERAIYRSPLVLLAVVVALFLGLLLISPETVTTWFTLVLAQPLSNALNAALPLAGVLGVMAAIGIVVYWWWTRRRAKTADASTPDTVLRINADEGDGK